MNSEFEIEKLINMPNANWAANVFHVSLLVIRYAINYAIGSLSFSLGSLLNGSIS